VDSAEILAADLQDLLTNVRRRCHADRVDDDLVEVEVKQVAVVLAVFSQRGVVRLEAEDRAVVGDPDEQRPALPAVEERGYGLEPNVSIAAISPMIAVPTVAQAMIFPGGLLEPSLLLTILHSQAVSYMSFLPPDPFSG
jgi:hypothetical protein